MTYRTQTWLLVLCCSLAGPWLASAQAQDGGVGDTSGGDAGVDDAASGDAGTPDAAAPTAEDEVVALDDEDVKTLEQLPERIHEKTAMAEGMIGRVAQIKGSNTITGKQADQYVTVLRAQIEQLNALKPAAVELENRRTKLTAEQEVTALRGDLSELDKQVTRIESTLEALQEQITDLSVDKGWSLVDKLLAARCATAICFANGESKYWLGIEPLVELPVGFSSALGNTGLAEYINNHELRVDLAAGLRVWLFDDLVSVSVYLSKPLIDANIRTEGSAFVYPGTSVRRPFPGFSLGLFFDSIWVGFDRNELRNGDSDNSMSFNSDFPPNVVVSSAWTITIALQPITAFRTALGTANKAAEED